MRLGGCWPPAPDVNDASPDGTRALTMAIVNAHYEVAGAAARTRGRSERTGSTRFGAACAGLDAESGLRRRAAAHVDRHASTAWSSRARCSRAARSRTSASTGRRFRSIAISGRCDAPAGISIGRNWMSFVGATPFFIAAKGADLALMRLLIEHGADPKAADRAERHAADGGRRARLLGRREPGPESGIPESQALEAVKLCLELGNDVNAVTDYGGTVIAGDPQVLLHRHPLNLAEYADKGLGDMRWGGSTALHGAALRGADSIVRYLVEKGARIDARNKLGWTPLTVANGVFVANTEKRWPSTVALLQDLEAPGPDQPDTSVDVALTCRAGARRRRCDIHCVDVSAGADSRAGTAAARQARAGGAATMSSRCCSATASAVTTQRLRTGSLALDGVDLQDIGAHHRPWRRSSPSCVPPRCHRPGGRGLMRRPTMQVASWLETELDRVAAARPESRRPSAASPTESHRIQERGA